VITTLNNVSRGVDVGQAALQEAIAALADQAQANHEATVMQLENVLDGQDALYEQQQDISTEMLGQLGAGMLAQTNTLLAANRDQTNTLTTHLDSMEDHMLETLLAANDQLEANLGAQMEEISVQITETHKEVQSTFAAVLENRELIHEVGEKVEEVSAKVDKVSEQVAKLDAKFDASCGRRLGDEGAAPTNRSGWDANGDGAVNKAELLDMLYDLGLVDDRGANISTSAALEAALPTGSDGREIYDAFLSTSSWTGMASRSDTRSPDRLIGQLGLMHALASLIEK